MTVCLIDSIFIIVDLDVAMETDGIRIFILVLAIIWQTLVYGKLLFNPSAKLSKLGHKVYGGCLGYELALILDIIG